MHIRIACLAGVLRRALRTDDRALDNGPRADLQTPILKRLLDLREQRRGQFVLLQQTAKLPQRRSIRYPFMTPVDAHESAQRRAIQLDFLACFVGLVEPMLRGVRPLQPPAADAPCRPSDRAVRSRHTTLTTARSAPSSTETHHDASNGDAARNPHLDAPPPPPPPPMSAVSAYRSRALVSAEQFPQVRETFQRCLNQAARRPALATMPAQDWPRARAAGEDCVHAGGAWRSGFGIGYPSNTDASASEAQRQRASRESRSLCLRRSPLAKHDRWQRQLRPGGCGTPHILSVS